MGLPRKPLTTPRKGCTECKRRHIKCDESQPRCGNCNISFRHCSYEELISKARAFIPPSQGSSSRSIITPAAKACPQDDNRGSAGDSPPLNKLHLELFHHFVTNILTFFGLDSVSSLELVKIILGAPYLMNEIIGFAALNLSIIRLLQQTFYRHHAVQLQTHALTEFNGANLVITPDTCLLMFLFSSILAMHMLCDKLRFLEGTFDTFLDDFIQSLRLHRCIRAVTSDSWPVLLQSPLKALLETENKALSNDGVTGKECVDLLDLINAPSTSIELSARETYIETIKYLQSAYDGSHKHPFQLSGPSILGRLLFRRGTLIYCQSASLRHL